MMEGSERKFKVCKRFRWNLPKFKQKNWPTKINYWKWRTKFWQFPLLMIDNRWTMRLFGPSFKGRRKSGIWSTLLPYHVKRAQGQWITNHSVRNQKFHIIKQEWVIGRGTSVHYRNDLLVYRGLSKTSRMISLPLKKILKPWLPKMRSWGARQS
jgi:hypothetical protein